MVPTVLASPDTGAGELATFAILWDKVDYCGAILRSLRCLLEARSLLKLLPLFRKF